EMSSPTAIRRAAAGSCLASPPPKSGPVSLVARARDEWVVARPHRVRLAASAGQYGGFRGPAKASTCTPVSWRLSQIIHVLQRQLKAVYGAVHKAAIFRRPMTKEDLKCP